MFDAFVLPILQSVLAAAAYEEIKNVMYADDGSDNDAFRKVMREAFVDAVKKVRKDANDAQIEKAEQEEFRYYQKVIIDEIVHLEPTDRKKYINQELYTAFKYEVMKRQAALQHLNISLAQECMKAEARNSMLLEQLINSVTDISNSVAALVAENVNSAALIGLVPSRIVEAQESNIIEIPVIHTDRPEFVSKIKVALEDRKCILLYSGVKEGKTIASGLLAKAVDGYRSVLLDFANENRINLENALTRFDKEEKIVFVLDAIRYDDDKLYEILYRTVQQAKSEKWLFILNSYQRFSACMIESDSQMTEIGVPPLSESEVNEMIPEEKRVTYSQLIYGSFKGQPLLTQVICSILANDGWSETPEELEKVLKFPQNSSLRKKIRRLTLQMINDDEAYHLLNRLMLFNRSFTENECCEIAAITPVIANPLKRLESLSGSWVKECDGHYEVSGLIQKALTPDLVKNERNDCCRWMVMRLIGQKQGLSLTDAMRVLTLLIATENGEEVAAFYVSMLYKLDDADLLRKKESLIWRLIWMDVPLPSWMGDEDIISIRVAQLTLLIMKAQEKSEFIVRDIEERLGNVSGKSLAGKMAAWALCMYYLMQNESANALKYRNQSLISGEIEGLPDIEDDKIYLLTLNSVRDKNDMMIWAESYVDNGKPNIDVIGEGLIMVVNKLCDNVIQEETEQLLREIIEFCERIKYEDLMTVCCARLIDLYSESGRMDDVRMLFDKYRTLSDTPLGTVLLNYSYGLCLNNHGAVEEGLIYIEKCCDSKDLSLACGVMMNATTTLAQIKGNMQKKDEALEALLQLKQKEGYNTYYSDYEQTLIEASLSYAYWMVGNRECSVNALLTVVKWLKKNHLNQSDDYKNLSVRLSVLVLYMSVDLKGGEPDPKYAQPDYGTFTKTAPTLLQEYKTERNFTVMYMIYELAEKVLKDEEKSIELIDEVLALQRSDAKNMAALLSILILAYPLCLRHGRKDLVEYILLGALSGYVNKEGYDPEERKIDYEHLVLMSAVTSTVMERVCKMAAGQEPDDEWMFDLIERSYPYIPDHSRTDEMVDQMLAEIPNYDNIHDESIRCVVGAYHAKRLKLEEALFVLYVMAKSLLSYNQMPSAEKMVKQFARDFAYLTIKEQPNRFSLELNEFDRFFGRIGNKQGLDYVRSILNGLHFKLKSEVKLPKELVAFMEEEI